MGMADFFYFCRIVWWKSISCISLRASSKRHGMQRYFQLCRRVSVVAVFCELVEFVPQLLHNWADGQVDGPTEGDA